MSNVAIKISSTLAEQARAAADDADRSLTGQIEHWARLGRSLEPSLSPPAIAALKKSGGDLSALEDEHERASVLAVLDAFRATPRAELRQRLGLDRKVRFEPDPRSVRGIIRISPDGTRRRGTMKGRTFVPAS